MKPRAQLGTGTHDALRPACPTSSVPLHVNSNTDMYAHDSTIHTSARTVAILIN